MDIKIEGNPGTGNTFQEIIIHNAQNVNPNATTVINYNYGASNEASSDGGQMQEDKGRKSNNAQEDVAVKPYLIKDILNYLKPLSGLIHPDRKDVFEKMWEGILNLNAVKPFLAKRGKQKRTNFNRTLIARILHHLDARKMYAKPYKASDFARALEGKYEASVRGELGKFPSDNICYEIDRFLESQGLYDR